MTPGDAPELHPDYQALRARILRAITYSAMALGLVAYIPSAGHAWVEGFWGVAVLDTVAYGWVAFTALMPGLSYQARAINFVGIAYLLALGLSLILGPAGMGILWLLAFSLMTTALLGKRAAVASIVLNLVTVLGVALAVYLGWVVWPPSIAQPLQRWLIFGSNLVFLNGVICVALAKLLEGLQRSLAAERVARRDLERERAELERANLDLQAQGVKRRELEGQLRRAQKMEAVGTLAGGLAHDFNNILQGVAGYVQLLLAGGLPPERQRQSLEEADRILGRAAELVRRLMTFSREARAELRPVDVNGEVRHAVALLERTIPRMIRIETDLDPRLDSIQGDAGQLGQVLMNLGTNARDAMPQGGVLRFQTRNRSLDEAYARRHLEVHPGKYVELTVSDSGQGMDPQTLGRIFEPFFTTKSQEAGTGLGLAMVYSIVSSHGGHITCTSRAGEGTTFRVMLPAWRNAARPPAPEPEPEADLPAAGAGERVLVVDDEPAILETARDLLETFGYRPLVAASGEEALELCARRDEAVDLVVLDLGMPGMGGLDCLERLLALDPGLKVVISSGYGAGEAEDKARRLGARDFLAKPYRLTEILRTVRAVLDA